MLYKKISIFMLIILAFLSLFSCKSPNEISINKPKMYGNNYNEITVDSVDISDVEAGKKYQNIKFPVISVKGNKTLQDSLDILNDSIQQDAEDFKSMNAEHIRDFIVENPSMKEAEYSYIAELSIARNDEKYLSITKYVYENTMGAHGNYTLTGYTYDVESGKELTLNDFINNKEELRTYLIDWTTDHKNDYGFFDEVSVTINDFIDGEYELQYYINDNLVIVFQPYDIAPYAAGLIEIAVDKKLLKVDISDIR